MDERSADRSVVAFVRSQAEHEAILGVLPERAVLFCRDQKEFSEAARGSRETVLVYEAGAWPEWPRDEIVRTLGPQGHGGPIVIRINPKNKRAYYELVQLAEMGFDLRPSMQAFQRITVPILSQGSTGLKPTGPIIRRIAPGLAGPVLKVVAAIVVIAFVPRRVADVAAAAGLKVPEVKGLLREAGLPRAKTIVGIVVALHILWDIEANGYTTDDAAEHAGFETSRACSDYVKTHTGLSLGQMTTDCGFADLLDKLAATLIAQYQAMPPTGATN